jgi:hypothetical protein
MKASAWLLLGALFVAGCAGGDTDQPGSPGFKGTSTATGAKVRSQFTLARMVRRSPHRIWQGNQALIYLSHPDSTASVDGGTVIINGVTIPKRAKNGITWYQTLDTDAVPLTFNGANHVFAVTGTTAFPAMADSIQSPIGETNITAPLPGDTVSKATGFSLTWGPTDAVTGVHIAVADTAMHEFRKTLTANSGSYTVSYTDIAGLATGPLSITVTRGNVKQQDLSSSQSYELSIYTLYGINAVLIP